MRYKVFFKFGLLCLYEWNLVFFVDNGFYLMCYFKIVKF